MAHSAAAIDGEPRDAGLMKGEVVLVSRLRAALEGLNAGRMGHPALPPEAITAAVDELARDGSALWRLSGPEKLNVN